MKWPAFIHDGKTYDLSHLHPCTLEFERPAIDKKPAVIFHVNVSFGQHCFSRGLPSTRDHDQALECIDGKEIRLFDFDRWHLSKRLPEIIQTLAERRCQHAGRANFFTIDIIAKDGAVAHYDVFFTVSKSSQKGYINLFVQSAYVREKNNQPAGKPIRFLVILHNTLNKQPIRA